MHATPSIPPLMGRATLPTGPRHFRSADIPCRRRPSPRGPWRPFRPATVSSLPLSVFTGGRSKGSCHLFRCWTVASDATASHGPPWRIGRRSGQSGHRADWGPGGSSPAAGCPGVRRHRISPAAGARPRRPRPDLPRSQLSVYPQLHPWEDARQSQSRRKVVRAVADTANDIHKDTVLGWPFYPDCIFVVTR